MNNIIKEITREQEKKNRNHFKTGDGVKVYQKILEGEKERVQIFSGLVIAMRGSGINRTFTVRRLASGVSVEKVFPINLPTIEKIEVKRQFKIRRGVLNYVRGLSGKSLRFKEVKKTKK